MEKQRDTKQYALALSHLARIHMHKELINIFPFIPCLLHIFAYNKGYLKTDHAYTAVMKLILGSEQHDKMIQQLDERIQREFIHKCSKMRSYMIGKEDDSKSQQEECFRVLNVYDAFRHGGGNAVTVAIPLLERTRKLITRYVPLPKYINQKDLIALLFATSRWTFLCDQNKMEILNGSMTQEIFDLLKTAREEVFLKLLQDKFNPEKCLLKFNLIGYNINFRTKEAYYCRNDLNIALLLVLQLPRKLMKRYIKYSSVDEAFKMIVIKGELESYELSSTDSKKHRTEHVLFVYTLLSIIATMLS